MGFVAPNDLSMGERNGSLCANQAGDEQRRDPGILSPDVNEE